MASGIVDRVWVYAQRTVLSTTSIEYRLNFSSFAQYVTV